jgi:hypothetical protein
MPTELFVLVQFTTKAEPIPNGLLVLDKTRYQRNAVVQPLAVRLGITLLFLPSRSPKLISSISSLGCPDLPK